MTDVGPSLESLAPEIIFLILLDLPVQDLCHLSQASSDLHQCCLDWNVWAEKACRDFGCPKNVFLTTKSINPGSRYAQIKYCHTYPHAALTEAAKNGEVELGRYLIELINEPLDLDDDDALYLAAELGHCEMVQMLIDAGASSVDFALTHAIDHNQPRVVQILVRHMIKSGCFYRPTFMSKQGGDAIFDYRLYLAGKSGHLEVVKTLLDFVLPSIESSSDSESLKVHSSSIESCLNLALNGASSEGHLDIVQFALQAGATDFDSALELAVLSGHAKVVEELISAGSRNLDEALLIAAKHGHCDVVRVLFNAGADRRDRALEKAAKHGNVDVVKFLLRAGARSFDLALYRAVKNYHLQVIDAIIDYHVPTREVLDRALTLAIECDPQSDAIVWRLQRVISLLPTLRNSTSSTNTSTNHQQPRLKLRSRNSK